jgi:hypothetical protein
MSQLGQAGRLVCPSCAKPAEFMVVDVDFGRPRAAAASRASGRQMEQTTTPDRLQSQYTNSVFSFMLLGLGVTFLIILLTTW